LYIGVINETLFITERGFDTFFLTNNRDDKINRKKILMNDSSFKTAFKACRFGRKQTAGRNSSGQITSYHRGGGSKKLYRQIDFWRNIGALRVGLTTKVDETKTELIEIAEISDNLVNTTISTGTVQRLEYDPNRSAQIALIKWVLPSQICNSLYNNRKDHFEFDTEFDLNIPFTVSSSYTYFSYIIACDKLQVGDQILNSGNIELNKSKLSEENSEVSLSSSSRRQETQLMSSNGFSSNEAILSLCRVASPIEKYSLLPSTFLSSKPGNSGPLCFIPLGSFIYNIEIKPGGGGQLVRSAGTYAQLIQNRKETKQTIIRLPSGMLKLLDSRCRATIGTVSNSSHSIIKLKKAGQNRWLGRRPIVRGVAMNPIDHPHGGGEGRTKGGRPSVSPWGKPTKGGFKTSRRVSSIQRLV
jgi:ribosomal protein L2